MPKSQFKDTLSVVLLKEFFSFRAQRLVALLLMIISIIQAQTNNMKTMSNVAKTKAKSESTYKRFRRFIKSVKIPQASIANFIIYALSINTDKKWIVSMDRTYWMFGKIHLNFLYLALVYKGYAIPLFFTLCGPNKKGHSSIEERNILLQEFYAIFGKNKIQYLTADREFMGHEWIKEREKQGIDFVIRFKENGVYMANSRGIMKKACDICRFLKVGKAVYLGLRKVGRIKSYYLHMTALKRNDGEIILLGHSPEITDPCGAYRFRWSIELCFRSMKSYGFNMEDTSVTDTHRITCLMQIVIMAFAWSMKVGEKIAEIKPIEIKKHGYKAVTLVKLGLNSIQHYLSACFVKILDTSKIIRLFFRKNISIPPKPLSRKALP